jgi:hypothetical protein
MPANPAQAHDSCMWLRRIIVAVAAYALFAGALATFYFVVQQDGRSAVEDAPRALLSAGPEAVKAPPSQRFDLTQYDGTFWVRYDATGTPVAGDGVLHGSLAQVPYGVLQNARAAGEDAVSWEPQPGLRFAIVAQPFGTGSIVAGQSLHRTEQRIQRTGIYVGLALVAGFVVVGIAVVADALVARRRAAPLRRPDIRDES